MVFLSLINFYPACSLAVRILLILIFFAGSFLLYIYILCLYMSRTMKKSAVNNWR